MSSGDPRPAALRWHNGFVASAVAAAHCVLFGRGDLMARAWHRARGAGMVIFDVMSMCPTVVEILIASKRRFLLFVVSLDCGRLACRG